MRKKSPWMADTAIILIDPVLPLAAGESLRERVQPIPAEYQPLGDNVNLELPVADPARSDSILLQKGLEGPVFREVSPQEHRPVLVVQVFIEATQRRILEATGPVEAEIQHKNWLK